MLYRYIIGTFLSSAALGAVLAVFSADHALSHQRVPPSGYEATNLCRPLDPPNHIKQAQPQQPLQSTEVAFSFQHAPLREVVSFISNVTHRRFIVDPNVDLSQPVSFMSSGSFSPAETFRSFLQLLNVAGLALVPHGEFTLITLSPSQPEPTVWLQQPQDLRPVSAVLAPLQLIAAPQPNGYRTR